MSLGVCASSSHSSKVATGYRAAGSLVFCFAVGLKLRGCAEADLLFARRVCSVSEAVGQSHEVTVAVLQLNLKSLYHPLVRCGLHCSHTAS